MAVAKSLNLYFTKKEQLAKETFSFYFDRSHTDFDFLPGQYISMSIPHENADDRGTTRFFTIASSPHEKDYLMFTIKILESSFKQTLFSLQPGQRVQFFGPMGKFVLDESDTTPRVFLAGGIGMTPFHSMIIYAAAKNLVIPMKLFVGFSKPEEMIFHDKLTNIANKNSNIKIIYTLTQPEAIIQDWKGETGRITEKILKQYNSNIHEPVYYLAGSPTMVAQTRQLLQTMQIDEEKIISEDFSGY